MSCERICRLRSGHKKFGNPCTRQKNANRAGKIPFFSGRRQRAQEIFPNFSLAVLGDFNGLEPKKFGRARLVLSIIRARRSNRLLISKRASIIAETEQTEKEFFGSLAVSR